MSRKPSKKNTKPSTPAPGANAAGTVYPVEPADLDRQQARLRNAAASAAGALKPAPSPDPVAPSAAPPPPTGASTSSTTLKPPGQSGSTPRPVSQPQPATATVEASTASSTAAPAPKPAAPSKPLEAPGKQTRPGQTQESKTAGQSKVTFVLLEPGARQVSLRGEFNGWSPDANPMERHHDGRWETTVALAPGRYEYKFFVDGQWVPDPQAPENVWNHHGTLNSVLKVGQ